MSSSWLAKDLVSRDSRSESAFSFSSETLDVICDSVDSLMSFISIISLETWSFSRLISSFSCLTSAAGWLFAAAVVALGVDPFVSLEQFLPLELGNEVPGDDEGDCCEVASSAGPISASELMWIVMEDDEDGAGVRREPLAA